MKAISAQMVSFASMPLQHTKICLNLGETREDRKMFCSMSMKAISAEMVSFANMPLQHKESV